MDSSQSRSGQNDKYKIKKTIVFMILDVIMMFLFAWVWFRFVHDSTLSPSSESFRYTACMTTFFAAYYYTFERSWKYIEKYINMWL